MESRIRSIKFDLGSLPVKDSDGFEMIDMPDNVFPGQFLHTKKTHKRTLNVLLGKAVSGDISRDIFTLHYSFPYYLPELKDEQIEDNPVSITRRMPSGSGAFGLVYSNVTAPSVEFFNDKKIIYGKLPRHNEETKKTENLILDHPKECYEFYSMDKNMNVHKTKIDVNYFPKKDLMKFNVVYDDKIKVILDTKGNYLLKNLKVPYKERVKKAGNLLDEKDFTLYLDSSLPVKVSAETS